MSVAASSAPPPRRRAWIGALVVAGTALWIAWPRDPPRRDAPGATATSPAPDRRALAANERGGTAGRRSAVASAGPAAGPTAPPMRLPRSARLRFGEVDDPRLLGLTPELSRFVDIQRKALRSREDIAEALALASDRGLIDEAARGLGLHDPAEQQALARRRRMVLVDFLRFALLRGGEPRYAASAIGDVIASGALAEGEPIEIRKTFVGDRIELARSLKEYDPAELERLRARVAGSPAERSLAYGSGPRYEDGDE
ncbi:hypothetical protein WMF28_18960 [Sorangium sp. So ce590]|uniref:hypothetical protein n=1 Tax=Sorangium sp. So ce590 TaxID=3133317 RepID=UPI003F61019E